MKRFTIFMFLVLSGFSTVAMAQTNMDGAIKDGAVTDREGNSYSIARIGNQLWMAENLRTTKSRDGKAIAKLDIGKKSSSPGIYWHDNSSGSANSKTYGPLYNWATVKDCDVCPKGWRIPSQDDWNLVFRNWYGKTEAGVTIEPGAKGLTFAAYQLRETGNIWPNNSKASNSTGFSARPGGWLWGTGFAYLGQRSGWWSTKNNNQTPIFAKIAEGDNGAWTGEASTDDILYIRCVKEAPCSTNIHWKYEGEEGPEHWGELGSPCYPTCSAGKNQSPIDLVNAKEQDLTNIAFNYQTSKLKVRNNGHTVQFNCNDGGYINVNGQKYVAQQYHYHAPSEHTVAGKQYDAELHIVHQSASGQLAVVGILLERGAQSAEIPAYKTLTDNLQEKVGFMIFLMIESPSTPLTFCPRPGPPIATMVP